MVGFGVVVVVVVVVLVVVVVVLVVDVVVVVFSANVVRLSSSVNRVVLSRGATSIVVVSLSLLDLIRDDSVSATAEFNIMIVTIKPR